MTSDDSEQVPSSLANISLEKIDDIAFKIKTNKSLNADDRQTIYLALTGEWDPLSSFHKPRGRKSKATQFRALAEDVERIKAASQSIIGHIPDLGKKHQLHGLEEVSLDTFNKNLKSGRKSLAIYRKFRKNLAYRKQKKSKATCN